MTTQPTATTELAWSPRSESPLTAAGRSGPVPMRPMALGEILDGAVALLRRHPGATMGLAAVLMAIQLALTVPVQFLTQDFTFSLLSPLETGGGDGGDPLLALLGIVVSTTVVGVIAGLCAGVVSGLTAAVVGRAALHQPATVRLVWAEVKPRLWSLIGLSALISVASGIGSLFFGVGSFFVGAAFAVAVPALILERVGPFRAVKRGWDLTFTGFSAFLRVFGIRALAVVVGFVWQFLVAAPFVLAAQIVLMIDAPRAPSAGLMLLAVFLTGLGTMAGGIVTTPFLGAVDGLLYVDRRMRAEGFDIELGQRLRRGATVRGVA